MKHQEQKKQLKIKQQSCLFQTYYYLRAVLASLLEKWEWELAMEEKQTK